MGFPRPRGGCRVSAGPLPGSVLGSAPRATCVRAAGGQGTPGSKRDLGPYTEGSPSLSSSSSGTVCWPARAWEWGSFPALPCKAGVGRQARAHQVQPCCLSLPWDPFVPWKAPRVMSLQAVQRLGRIRNLSPLQPAPLSVPCSLPVSVPLLPRPTLPASGALGDGPEGSADFLRDFLHVCPEGRERTGRRAAVAKHGERPGCRRAQLLCWLVTPSTPS